LIMALLMLLRLAIYLAIGAIFLQVILSWVNPSSPVTPVVSALTRPMLQPIQRIVPPIGMVDLSPLIALLLLQLLLMVPLAYLERAVGVGF
ncbi:MAG TPA: YggT family protein, partial [Burkholderiales bacterium]|nr:YggT family protein [Burkholderiales bacterium]